MSDLFLFPNACRPNAAVQDWLGKQPGLLGDIARHWFDVLCASGADVCEVLHDGHPTACVGQAAFAYVNVFSAHVNVGFFQGASLPDSAGLLQGSGKRMRHVKLLPATKIDEQALRKLVELAYADMARRVAELE